jgi:serine phosphatase RsbU (regulator of sigma subunit)
LAEQSRILCKKANYELGESIALRNLGVYSYISGAYENALNYYFEGLKIAQKINYRKGIARMYNNIAATYNRQGRYAEALDYHFKALKIREEIGDRQGVAASWHNIGIIYENQGKVSEALEMSLKSLMIEEELGNKIGVAESLINISELYIRLGKYDEALLSSARGLKLHEELGDKRGIAYNILGIATIYTKQKLYKQAEENYLKSLKICEELGDKRVIVSIKKELSIAYLQLKNYEKALLYAKASLDLATEIGLREQIADNHETISLIYKTMGKYQLALTHYELFKVYGDSVRSIEAENKTAFWEAQYQNEKRLAALQKEQAQKDIAKEKEIQANKFQRNAFIAGFIVLAVVVGLIFRNLQKQRKAKEILEAKNKEIQRAKEEIQQQAEELREINQELKQTYLELQDKSIDIQDSISAAQRIQNALLPLVDEMEKIIGGGNYFVLFKPKDIVSGDFYWVSEQKDKKIIVVADSTGHSVPGALMSMIGMQLLEQLVNENLIVAPERLLLFIHTELIRLLKQKQTLTNEGMDIAVVVLSKNDTNFTLEYAGAMIPLLFIQNNELVEVKADRSSLGGFNTKHNFQKHSFEIQAPTYIYLYSDGYQDQFGGKNGKKFMAKNLRQLLLDNHQKTLAEQGQVLDTTIENWKKIGNEQQIDDITILGIKIS